MSQKSALDNTYFVIMAGGVGSRFWPSSRESRPKQFLDILGSGRSLIQMTYDRCLSLVTPDRIIVVTHEKYVDLVANQLESIPARNILSEPARNNTAPCVAYVSFHLKSRNPDANLVMLPSDHIITNGSAFNASLQEGIEFVSDNDALMTLGMKPHRPDTGYGYIQLSDDEERQNIFKVEAFREKPELELAQQYLAEGNYVWNAGIFLFNVDIILKAFKSLARDIYDVLYHDKVYGTDAEMAFIRDNYPNTASISFDYAIMEKSSNIYCIPTEIGWSDLGTWKSLYELMSGSLHENISNVNKEDCHFVDSRGVLVNVPNGKKVVIGGVEDLLIIDDEDVLLVWPKDREQEIKAIKQKVAARWNLE
ncbi:mannose-1-phosphate guanylyltransferase [Membranihabitans maritimus]|uniref:mannose-1-phosphate guanylyltransferase n=1 Tax=Membranihabitans maritimus TaxID=2904244 RepID=UPI001F26F52E|nr:mannose-1-phosphate guanylyltransferase [Membranihabitans maritimus]